MESVRKSYNGTPVLSIDRMEIPKGAQWVVTGESGSGKTTFLYLAAGILTPDAGVVRVAGQAINELTEAKRDRWRAEKIGFIFQTFNLLQGFSALENVLLGMLFAGKSDPDRARALLDRVGLGELMHRSPRELSVGQQQRVAIARALANRPEIILTGHPTIMGVVDKVWRDIERTLPPIDDRDTDRRTVILTIPREGLLGRDPASSRNILIGEFKRLNIKMEMAHHRDLILLRGSEYEGELATHVLDELIMGQRPGSLPVPTAVIARPTCRPASRTRIGPAGLC